MAKFKLTAGAEFDTITKKEMEDVIRQLPSWMAESAQGIRYTRIYANATVVSNAVDFGSDSSVGQPIGPTPGFIWDVRRLRISNVNAADVYSLYINDINPSSLIATTADVSGNRLFLWSEQVILYPGDTLRIVGTGLNVATTQVTVSGQAREVPMTLAWRLGN